MGNDIVKMNFNYAMSDKELESKFESLSRDELLNYVKQLSLDFDIVNNFFRLEFASINNVFALSCDYINHYINSGIIDGHIPSTNVKHIIGGGEQVLEKANKSIAAMQNEQAALLCVAVLSCYIPILSLTDDRIDAISFLIDRSITSLNNITLQVVKSDCDEEEIKRVYEIIKNNACDPIYDNWIDWRAELLSACVCLAGDDEIRKSLYEAVDDIIDKLPDNKWYKKYVTKRLKEIIYNLIKTFDGDDAAHNFVWENLDYDNFRDIAINLSMTKKEYRTVIKLCTDIPKTDDIDSVRLFKWKNDLLEAYRQMGDTANEKIVLEDLIIQGKTEYYDDLKKLYSDDEWKDELELIIEMLKDEKSLIQKYLEILILENKQDLIVECCLENPEHILNVYNNLDILNKRLLHERFEEYIMRLAENANTRSDYKIICEILGELEKKCNKSLSDQIITELRDKYSRKTAFIEELNIVALHTNA